MTLATELAHFTGTQEYHRFSPFARNAVMTDGVKHLADKANAYWFLDVIASYIPRLSKKGQPFAVAKLKKNKTGGATFRLDNGNDKASGERVQYAQQTIHFTDFPFGELGDEFKVYVSYNGTYWVVMLTSEY